MIAPALVPTMTSAAAGSKPASCNAFRTPAWYPIPTSPPPPKTSPFFIDSSLASCNLGKSQGTCTMLREDSRSSPPACCKQRAITEEGDAQSDAGPRRPLYIGNRLWGLGSRGHGVGAQPSRRADDCGDEGGDRDRNQLD